MRKRQYISIAIISIFLLAACHPQTATPLIGTPSETRTLPTQVNVFPTVTSVPLSTPGAPVVSPTSPAPARLLTICTSQEPESLFLYDARSPGAINILSAIYDGPFDVINLVDVPVILTKLPSLADGDVKIEPVQVNPGDSLVDWDGNLIYLAAGVAYLPSGCSDPGCAQTYSGTDPVTMDRLVVSFALKPGVTWADGRPVTASDSVYSYQVAKGLPAGEQPVEVGYTQTYQATGDLAVEWRGIPGFLHVRYARYFFTPLPQHAWGSMAAADLRSADLSARMPMGWGAYQITQWTAGDHISLRKNPNYFRASEGLPYFDNLVVRFVGGEVEALSALLAGECDFVDQTVPLELQIDRLLQLQAEGKLGLQSRPGASWEVAVFGIQALDAGMPDLFGLKETRQAIARCIDRQAIAASQPSGQSMVFDSYIPSFHPLYNANLSLAAFSPDAAIDLLETVGWLDADGDPATPRTAQGVANVADGTPFELSYLVSEDAASQAAAQIVKASLAQCGIRVELVPQAPQDYLAAGPEGPVFGRKFQMAQFAWPVTLDPACFLFQSSEIPGPYPGFSKGWGGINAMGYSNSEFDLLCQITRTSPVDTPAYRQASDRAQIIFADDAPLVPLFVRAKWAAFRPDFCGLPAGPALDGLLWNLEAFDYGESCNVR